MFGLSAATLCAKIIPAETRRLAAFRGIHYGPAPEMKIMLESNPLQSRILVRRLAVLGAAPLASVRPLSVLRFWTSEGSTQAES